jgi:hypothetical protein
MGNEERQSTGFIGNREMAEDERQPSNPDTYRPVGHQAPEPLTRAGDDVEDVEANPEPDDVDDETPAHPDETPE